ncbi:DUF58 domain-containing protein [Pelobium manganitolerans]|uniref:DUF58 domain-containing protein n=1 Tax=Pelobium manganitolerans TaxID=1842495 RepID=UPI003FA3A8AB
MVKPGFDLEQHSDFGNLELLATQVVEGFITGLHKSPFHGFSVEFAEHRLYNKGNSVKNIDWKLYGRTEKLFVKRFEEETNLRCQLVLDVSSSMYYPENGMSKFAFSALASAAMINLLKRQRDAFGLTLFSNEISLSTPTKSTTAHQKFILDELSKNLNSPVNTQQTNLASSLHRIADKLPQRSFVVVFTDMLFSPGNHASVDEVFSALQHIKYNKNELIVFNVLEKQHEQEFNFANRPHHFIDVETGQNIKLNPSAYQEIYREKLQAFKETLAIKCAQSKINLVDADLEDGFYPILKAWLLARSRRKPAFS